MFCQKCGMQNPDNGKFCRACGTDLGNGSAVAGGFFQPMQPMQPRDLKLPTADYYTSRKGMMRSNNPDDLWSAGIRNIVLGVGFLIIAVSLFVTDVANGHRWWWAMLFPAFSLLSSGIGSVAKSKRLEKKKFQSAEMQPQTTFAESQTSNAGLPPAQTGYISPQRKSIYDTGEFVAPPSVTENTTRHLEINNEGEMMTFFDGENLKGENRK